MKGFFIFYSGLILIVFCLMYSLIDTNKEVQVEQKVVTYKIKLTGAIEIPNEYEIRSNQYIIDFLYEVGLRKNHAAEEADVYRLPTSNMSLEVPFGIININTADHYELTYLSGVGDYTANKIIEYRSKTPFKKKEDLKNIGNSIYEKNKDRITV